MKHQLILSRLGTMRMIWIINQFAAEQGEKEKKEKPRNKGRNKEKNQRKGNNKRKSDLKMIEN